jgi:hypothetical protein
MAVVPILLILTTVLSGCSTRPAQEISYTPRTIDKPNLILPTVDTLDMKEVDFIVITPDNAAQVFADLERSGKAVVVFAVDENSYKNLSLNMAQILKILSEQQAVIAAYENYYIVTINNIDKFNATQ